MQRPARLPSGDLILPSGSQPTGSMFLRFAFAAGTAGAVCLATWLKPLSPNCGALDENEIWMRLSPCALKANCRASSGFAVIGKKAARGLGSNILTDKCDSAAFAPAAKHPVVTITATASRHALMGRNFATPFMTVRPCSD